MSTNQKLSLCFFQIVKEQGKTGTTSSNPNLYGQNSTLNAPLASPPSLTGLGTACTER
jgi:hypothetical protein